MSGTGMDTDYQRFLYHVYCGAETGLLKGVNTAKKTFLNLNKSADLDRCHEITALQWADSDQTRIHCALRKQIVETYDAQTGLLLGSINVNAGDGPLKGLETIGDRLATCSQSGALTIWRPSPTDHYGFSAERQIDAGQDVFRMRKNPLSESTFATGGKENDLKLWDVHCPEKPMFVAKNVRNDHLDLRVPVWVTDLRFWDSSKIIVGTGYHKIRIYDTKSGQRRPVSEMPFDEYPITCLSLAGTRNPFGVLVANTHGRVALIDIRKQRIVHCFKGFSGSVRAIEVHPLKPYVVSCSLDRFLRVHDFERHVLLSKIYLKSRLSSLLIRTAGFNHSVPLTREENIQMSHHASHPLGADREVQNRDDSDDAEESQDPLWSNMGIMKEESESGIESDNKDNDVNQLSTDRKPQRRKTLRRKSEKCRFESKKARPSSPLQNKEQNT